MHARPRPQSRPLPRARAGHALILLLVLVSLAGLGLAAQGLDGTLTRRQRIAADGVALRQARDALLAYAAGYPDGHADQVYGYLPCPDQDGDGSADPLHAACASDGAAAVGLLPWRQLGLANNRDADGHCLWYAVAGRFKAASRKPVPLNWDTRGSFDIRDRNDQALALPDDDGGGAAAVVFAVGAPLADQVRPGIRDDAPCGIGPGAEALQSAAQYLDIAAGDGRRSAPFPGPAQGSLRLVRGTAGDPVNNDRLVWIAPREIFDLVRRRGDLAQSLDAPLNAAIDAVQARLAAGLAGYAPGAGDTLPSLDLGSGTAIANFHANFADHFRFRKCQPAGSHCFQINGVACDGVLLFGGPADPVRNGIASPRPAERRGSGDYLEDGPGGGLPLLAASGGLFRVDGAAQFFSSAQPAVDVVRCLAPRDGVDAARALGLRVP